MPSPYEAALMSYFSYEYKGALTRLENESLKAKKTSDFQLRNLLFPEGKKDLRFLFYSFQRTSRYSWAQFLHEKGWSVYDSYEEEALGYFGLAFINDNTKEIVIAHRGTTLGMDMSSQANYGDDIEILKGENGQKIPDILNCSIVFTVRVLRKRAEHKKKYVMHQTGHSLGGFLAEFGAAYIANPNPEFPNLGLAEGESDRHFRLHLPRQNDANAITFDSLGSVNILKKLEIPTNKANTINYLPKPNIANTANLHDGVRYLLLNQNQTEVIVDPSIHVVLNTQAQINFQEIVSTMDSHNLEKMIAAFSPITCKPYNYKHITTWPTATNIFTTAQNPVIPQIEKTTPFNKVFKGMVGILIHGMTKVIEFKHTRTGSLTYVNPATVVIPTTTTGESVTLNTLESNQPSGFFITYNNNNNSSPNRQQSMSRNTFSQRK